jgi:hypothetical protein
MGEKRDAYVVEVTVAERKSPLGFPKHRCEYNIKMDLKDLGLEGSGYSKVAGACELIMSHCGP